LRKIEGYYTWWTDILPRGPREGELAMSSTAAVVIGALTGTALSAVAVVLKSVESGKKG
jgi:hypothetical protein